MKRLKSLFTFRSLGLGWLVVGLMFSTLAGRLPAQVSAANGALLQALGASLCSTTLAGGRELPADAPGTHDASAHGCPCCPCCPSAAIWPEAPPVWTAPVLRADPLPRWQAPSPATPAPPRPRQRGPPADT